MKNEQNTELYRPELQKQAHICVIDNLRHITAYPVRNDITIGRAMEASDVECQISGRFLSRKHGRIYELNNQYYYEDLHSSNGTYINDVFYGGDSAAARLLQNGDIIRIGNVETICPGEEPVIIIFRSEDITGETWKSIDLSQVDQEIFIGRNRDSGTTDMSVYVSRKHASFFKIGKRMAVEDCGSLNGVYLNNQRIKETSFLYYGDCVRLADHYFIYLGDEMYVNVRPQKMEAVPKETISVHTPVSHKFHENQSIPLGPQLSINIADKTVFSKFKRFTLLKDIHMTVNNGEMVLILGGSGAGKTTFMNAVMGYEKANGTITHGEKDLYEDYDTIKYDIGFVPQQDLLRLSDSVYNTLRNAAEMKMPAHTKSQVREERVEEVMEMLGLTRERDSLVQKLSGGQKKRLSIAVELISNPGLFFLDEPDSGLDGIMARTLMENLRTIADQGKIVMVITHGPDRAVDLFDKVIVLAKSIEDNCGHLAFFGSVPQAFSFFECDSLEGVVRRINRKDEGGDGLSDHYIQKYQKMTGMEE